MTATAPSWQSSLAAGASWTVGYQATGPAAPTPTGFRLGSTPCAVT